MVILQNLPQPPAAEDLKTHEKPFNRSLSPPTDKLTAQGASPTVTPTPARTPTPIARRGFGLIISSPSGAGKSTLARSLLRREPDVHLSISVTTRPPRANEEDGRDYHFISEPEFNRLRQEKALLESATVFGYAYGSKRQPVVESLTQGRDVLFDVDWQGARQICAQLGADDVVRVFILPPSLEDLTLRLHNRAQDKEGTVRRRMQGARNEINHWNEYDYVIINHSIDRSCDELHAILIAERSRRQRQKGLAAFVTAMAKAPS